MAIEVPRMKRFLEKSVLLFVKKRTDRGSINIKESEEKLFGEMFDSYIVKRGQANRKKRKKV